MNEVFNSSSPSGEDLGGRGADRTRGEGGSGQKIGNGALLWAITNTGYTGVTPASSGSNPGSGDTPSGANQNGDNDAPSSPESPAIVTEKTVSEVDQETLLGDFYSEIRGTQP
ncbi:MAG: hypothetical protein Q4A79_01670 [Candidatus Saccharibacteria bacterium]|nr:hypothetical protein [Candidatus Saccharibacteria bacterium]